MFFALVETQGNQPYVFSTNREKAIRGASELLFRSTTDWVIDAVVGTRADRGFDERATWLRNQSPIGDGTTVVVATSGRAVLVGSDPRRLEAIITDVTGRALREAPGLLVAGSIVPLDLEASKGFDSAFHQARIRLSSNLTAIGPRGSRSGNLPMLRPCAETGLAASEVDRAKDRSISYQFHAQIDAMSSSRSRLESLVGDNFASSVDEIALEDNWRAVIHADGNGIGRLFGALSELFDSSTEPRSANLLHIEGYREFSLALERATETALLEATASLPDGKVMPILLGGDDVIAQVSAHRALDFARSYLMAFERQSVNPIEILRKYSRPGSALPERLTSCAGVSIVKSHFPFSSASELASELLESAKSAKDDGRVSALDLHVTYDSTASDLGSIRQSRTSADGLKLWGGPYRVDSTSSPTARSLSDLDKALASLAAAGARSQIQRMKEASRRDRASLAAATTNALHVAGNDSVRMRAIETLATETDGHLLLLDALEIADIDRKVGAR